MLSVTLYYDDMGVESEAPETIFYFIQVEVEIQGIDEHLFIHTIHQTPHPLQFLSSVRTPLKSSHTKHANPLPENQ